MFEVFIGLVIAVIGFGMIYGMTRPLSIIKAFNKNSIVAAILVLMIIAGVYQTGKSKFHMTNG